MGATQARSTSSASTASSASSSSGASSVPIPLFFDLDRTVGDPINQVRPCWHQGCASSGGGACSWLPAPLLSLSSPLPRTSSLFSLSVFDFASPLPWLGRDASVSGRMAASAEGCQGGGVSQGQALGG
jgi:hypothetical protein